MCEETVELVYYTYSSIVGVYYIYSMGTNSLLARTRINPCGGVIVVRESDYQVLCGSEKEEKSGAHVICFSVHPLILGFGAKFASCDRGGPIVRTRRQPFTEMILRPFFDIQKRSDWSLIGLQSPNFSLLKISAYVCRYRNKCVLRVGLT